MSKIKMIAQIMSDDNPLRDVYDQPFTPEESDDLVYLLDAFLMHLNASGFDLKDLPIEAIKALVKIDKITREQNNESI